MSGAGEAAQSQPLQLIVVPATIHLVNNERYPATWARPRIETLLASVCELWAEAGITFTPNVVTTPVDTEALETAFLNASTPSERKPNCRLLLPLCKTGAVNLFLMDRMTYFQSPTRADWLSYKDSRLALASLSAPEPAQIVSTVLAKLMGVAAPGLEARAQAITLAAESKVERLNREVVEIPLVVHRVTHPDYGTTRSADNVQLLLDSLNFVWSQAGVRFRSQLVTSAVSTEALEASFPNQEKDLPRRPDCRGLKELANCDPQALNVFLVQRVPGMGAETSSPRVTMAYPRERVGLLADPGMLSDYKFLAKMTGELLGLPPDKDVRERLMNHTSGGLMLTPANIELARERGEELGNRRQSGPTQARRLGFQELVADRPEVRGFLPPENDTLEAVLAELEGLIGLVGVKRELSRLANYVRIESVRRDRGLPRNPLALHTVLVGHSGTGKTSVARLLARLYRHLGVLSWGHVLKIGRANLTAGTTNWLDWANDGVLLVDDAPAFTPAKGQVDLVLKSTLATLARRMEDDSERLVVMLTGRPEEMRTWLEGNPHIAHQVSHRLDFPDYSADELLEIFQGVRRLRGFDLTAAGARSVTQLLRRVALDKGSFGNARYPRMLFDQCLELQATRLIELAAPSDAELTTLDEPDIPSFRAARAFGRDHGIWDHSSFLVNEPPADDTLEKVMAELNALVGLAAVKEQVRSLSNLLAARKRRGESSTVAMHMVFTGPPGTGKTTVARLMGRIFHCLGLLAHGQVVETDRSGLVAGWVGQTAMKVNETVDRAIHGVLFIDEAYALTAGTAKDFGPEAVSTLLKRMEDGKDRLAVIAAGYPAEMQRWLDSNSGLQSRFAHRIEFEDYTPAELLAIFQGLVSEAGYRLDPGAEKAVAGRIDWLHAQKDDYFGNGRLMRSLFDGMISRQANRLADGELDELLLAEDLPEAQAGPLRRPSDDDEEGAAHYVISEVPRDDSLERIRQDLHGLVGLEPVKERLRTLINLARAEEARRAEGLPPTAINLHQVFSGSPGTGKTTVARLLGRIYRATHLLRRGHTLETDRSGLVSGWRGRTPMKVNEAVDKAMHGVLFVDEAYSLVGFHDSDGPHAVSSLMKRMEDSREQLAVVLAGYSKDMEDFLETNPGLASRFGDPMPFADYSPDELLAIFGVFCRPSGFTLDGAAEERLFGVLSRLYQGRDKSFGNGRLVRILFEKMVEAQANRLAEAPGSLTAFVAEDVPEMLPKGRVLGFRQVR